MPSVPYFCDYEGMDEFDEAWEQSFLDAHAELDEEFEEFDEDELDLHEDDE